MLHIKSSHITTSQRYRVGPDNYYEVEESDRYRGNPMRITDQCEDCGVYYDDVEGRLEECEVCGKTFCHECLGPHESEHFKDSEFKD